MVRTSSPQISRIGRVVSTLVGVVALGALQPSVSSAQLVFSAASSSAAGVQPIVDSFRSALGTLNPNVAGSFGSGRREINWDGVGNAFAAPSALPGNFFNVNSPRGVLLSTPGTGFAVSALASSGTAVEFGNIDPVFPTRFSAFSAERLFTPIGSNVTDVSFFIPGSTDAAVSTAFGAVFSDVDLDATTSLEFFNSSNTSLGIFFALGLAGLNESFSFLGVQFGADKAFSRVRITSGSRAVSAGGADNDMVVMDDFIYAEPMLAVQTVPEPATWVLLSFGLTAVGAAARRRKQ